MNSILCILYYIPQKQEKPKFVLCVTFSENGDTITGDSSGNILVWGKGTKQFDGFGNVVTKALEGMFTEMSSR